MTDQEIREIVERSYDARRREVVDEALSYFDSEATFRIVASAALGDLSRTVTGHDQLRAAFKAMFAVWDWKDFPIQSIVVEGATAVVHSGGIMHFSPTHTDVSVETLDVLKLKDGKIVEFTEFADTHMIASLMSEAGDAGAPFAGASPPSPVELTKSWFDRVWNQRDEAAVHAMMDESCLVAGLGLEAPGPDGFIAYRQGFLDAFENAHIDILDIAGDAESAAGHGSYSGRHRKSGKDVCIAFSFSARWKDGVLVAGRNVVDFFGLLEQIGEADRASLAAALAP